MESSPRAVCLPVDGTGTHDLRPHSAGAGSAVHLVKAPRRHRRSSYVSTAISISCQVGLSAHREDVADGTARGGRAGSVCADGVTELQQHLRLSTASQLLPY